MKKTEAQKQITYRQKHPERVMFNRALDRARKKNIDFILCEEDIVIPEYCPILKIKLVVSGGNEKPGGRIDSPSLDRIDNSKGYVQGNIQVISNLANTMKSSATKEQLILFAKYIQEEIDTDDH